jgi:hypothetical protein
LGVISGEDRALLRDLQIEGGETPEIHETQRTEHVVKVGRNGYPAKREYGFAGLWNLLRRATLRAFELRFDSAPLCPNGIWFPPPETIRSSGPTAPEVFIRPPNKADNVKEKWSGRPD